MQITLTVFLFLVLKRLLMLLITLQILFSHASGEALYRDGNVGLTVVRSTAFCPDGNILRTIGWMVTQFCTDIPWFTDRQILLVIP